MSTKRKSIQIITDPLLEPFFISKDEYSYTIKQNVTSDASHFRSNGKSKTYEKSLYYYPTFANALNKIAELKTENKDYSNIQEYLENYKQISNQIKKYTNGIRSTI
jgi:Tfp pilus assembly protein PilF